MRRGRWAATLGFIWLASLVAQPASASVDLHKAAVRSGHKAPDTAGFRLLDRSAPARPLAAGQAGLHIVRFRDAITAASWEAMQGVGAEVGSYLGDLTFLVRMTPEQAAELAGSPLVQEVTRYRTAWKVSPAVLKGTGKANLRVRTFQGQAPAGQSGFQTDSVRPGSGGSSVFQVQADRSEALTLAEDETVVFIDEAKPMQFFNDVARGIMQVDTGGGPWSNSLTGEGQVVGVADGGLDTGNPATLHPDLRSRLQTAFALGRPGDWSDPLGHGTHVAGSIAGDGTASGGRLKGVAPGASLVFQSVLAGDSTNGYTLGGIPYDLNELFGQAYAAGARIHSDSWGVPYEYGGWTYDMDAANVDNFTWTQKDFTVLFAVGNDGQSGTDTVSTPATAKNAISVGASENYRPEVNHVWGDNPNEIAVFSSMGNTPDNRVKPDVVAPGTWILSTRSALASDPEFWENYDSHYAYMGGTSMATPMTAGAAALVRQYYQSYENIATPPASLIKASLINGARDLGYGWGSKEQGWGRVDLTNSLFPASPRVNWSEGEAEGKALTTGGARSYSFRAGAGQMLKFTLVWTDYPGAPQVGRELVNDLDLTVTGPDGAAYYGNCFVSNTAAGSCGRDRVNNVENVYFAAPQAGVYNVKVEGHNVPVGPQPYSLVVSGVNTQADTAAPTVSITSPAAGDLVSGNVTIQAEAADDFSLSKVEFYADDQLLGTDSTAPYTWTWESSGVPAGSHTLTARAFDAVGLQGTSSPVVVTREAPAFAVSLAGVANNGFVKGTVPVTANVTAGAPVQKVEFYLNGRLAATDTAAPYTWSWRTTGLSDSAAYTLTAKVYDNAGNTVASDPVQVLVDNQLPTISLTRSNTRVAVSGALDLTAAAADNQSIASVEFYLDNGLQSTLTGAPYTWRWDTTGATNAQHSLKAVAYDQAGNRKESAAVAVMVDNAAPVIQSVAPADETTVRGTVSLSTAATDNRGVTRVEYYLDDALAGTATRRPFTYAWKTAGLDGSHTLVARAYDDAGNVSTWSGHLLVDNQSPAVSITEPAAGSAFPGRTVTVAADASDNDRVSRVEFFVDGRQSAALTAGPFRWDWNTAGVRSGNHTLKAVAYDVAGNRTESAPVSVVVDSSAPTVSISAPVGNASLKGSVPVRASVRDNIGVTRVEFRVDGTVRGTSTGGSSSPIWTWETTSDADGAHSLVAMAYDAAGNVKSSATVSVSVDNTSPSVSVTAPAAGDYIPGRTTITALAADNLKVAKVEFYVDTAKVGTDTSAPYSFTLDLSRYTGGSTHVITAMAYDASGNATTSEGVSVTVDKTKPVVQLTAPAGSAVLKGIVTLSAQASDAVALARVELYDGAALLTTVQSGTLDFDWDTARAAGGGHSLAVKAYDAAGNVASATLAVTVDNVAPTVSLSSPANDATLRGTLTLAARAADNRAVQKVEFYVDDELKATDTRASWAWSWKTATADNGSHTLKAVVYDFAGNQAESATVTVNVNN
jgi:subtilisin family serine protease